MNKYKIDDLEMDQFVDEVCEIVIEDMGGYECCAEYFTYRRTEELYNFAEDQYKEGASARKAARRYLAWWPEAQRFLKTGELDPITGNIRKAVKSLAVKAPAAETPAAEPPHKAARRARKALWWRAKASERESIEVSM